MDKALFRESDLDALLQALQETSAVFAPIPDGADGGAAFGPVESAKDLRLPPLNTRLSVKGVFFPQREELLRFSAGEPPRETLPGGTVVVFGVRPCDARSLTWLDGVFCGRAPRDPYFAARRENALVISRACDCPAASCFCTSTGGSPYGIEGADILASPTDSEGILLFEAATDKGQELLRAHPAFFTPADGGTMARRARREQAARAAMKAIDLAGLKERLDGSLESALWEQLSATCRGCGVCAFVCPSCHCFDITDETQGARGIRVRSWDSCQFPRFTLHASGHNPRPRRVERLRQRIMHKFSYAPETAGTVYCSGCGRCVRACPAGIDIRRVIAAFKDLP